MSSLKSTKPTICINEKVFYSLNDILLYVQQFCYGGQMRELLYNNFVITRFKIILQDNISNNLNIFVKGSFRKRFALKSWNNLKWYCNSVLKVLRCLNLMKLFVARNCGASFLSLELLIIFIFFATRSKAKFCWRISFRQLEKPEVTKILHLTDVLVYSISTQLLFKTSS